ncbi:hypothetical protein PIIN_10915, partial [Serendipita indica DSM 11827]
WSRTRSSPILDHHIHSEGKMSDTEMQMDTTEEHREVEHEESIEQSMDPAKILPTRIHPNMPNVDYTSRGDCPCRTSCDRGKDAHKT